ncbi:MAG: hypothetical protein ABI623_03270, partial [bacterium]
MFTLDIALTDSHQVEYYYTLGDVGCPEVGANGRPLKNRVVVVSNGYVRYDTVALWGLESVNVGHWIPADVFTFQSKWITRRLGMSYPESMMAENP